MSRRFIGLLSLVALLGLVRVTHAGLVGWWQLDEGAGTTTKDSSGNGNAGTLENNPTWVKSPYGKALAFANNRVAIPASKSLTGNLFQEPFTLTVWINPKRTGNEWQQIFRAWISATAGNDTLFINNDGRLSWRGRVSTAWAGGMCETAPGVVPADEWTHVGVTGDKTDFRIYLNGELARTSPWRQTDGANANYYLGGAPGDAPESYSGMIDEVRIHNRAMTAEQVSGLYSGVEPTFTKASRPNPAHGAIGVGMPLFQWTKGETALFHNVYLGTTPELTNADLKAARQPVLMYYHALGLTPGVTYYWRVDEIEADGVTIHTGDVWTFVTQDVKAYYPSPANGATEATEAPVLTWRPGQTAVKHHVYFGDSSDAVTQGTAAVDKGEVTDPSFTPGALESVTTYYWRVDEIVAGGTVRPGAVWTFTTCLSVDDFESYTNDINAKTTIFDTWIDGLTNSTGSLVGYMTAPFAEQTIVHGGNQSMPLDYNNVKTPFYSEAEREFTSTQDWTAGGVTTLVLYVRGRSVNAPGPLYLAVEDAAKKVSVVTYPDQAVTKATQWTPWKVPLPSLTGVNLARVKKLYVGVGDKAKPVADGAGRIFVDDIRVIK